LAKGLDDCDYLISLGTGWDMQEDLEQLGVKHIVSVEKNIEDAVKKVIENRKRISK
jgi:predicted Fe-Mo cluster-binding NifX family protein